MKHIRSKNIITLLVVWLAFPGPVFANGDGSADLPDSILTEGHIYRYLYTDRAKSERIMAEIRRRKMQPVWKLDYIEGDLNYNSGRNREALKHYAAALESPHVKGNDTLRMELLHRHISCYDGLHDETKKMRYIKLLMASAQKIDDKPMESVALFNMGKSLYYQGDKERGYNYMEQGAEMMEATDYRLKYDNLRYEYKTLVMFYERDGRYEDALRILGVWEEIVAKSTDDETGIDGLAETEMKDLYAQRTVALSRTGRKAEAAEYYKKFCELDRYLSRNNYLIMPYLFDIRQYDEIFRINLPRERFLIHRKDTVNYYMASILKFLGHAYRDVGDYKKSSSYFERLSVLRDSLKYREQESAAQEYSALYDSKEKDLQLRREKEENRMAWTVAGGVCVLLVMVGGFAVVIVRKNRTITMKNRTLVENLDEMFGYKDEAFRKQGEVLELQKQMAQLSCRLSTAADVRNGSVIMPSVQDETETERALFDRLRYEIESRELFLQKDFDKDTLAKDANISPRKLAKLFTTFAEKPFAEYMQDLRLAHAARLLRNNPNWKMDAVADNCCMSLRTFHRLFTKKFGISPLSFQKQETKNTN